MPRKAVDKKATIENILAKANSSTGYSIDVEKFNKRKNSIKFLKECAEFMKVDVAYIGDKGVCDECEREFDKEHLRPFKYEPSRKVCDDCHDELMIFDEEEY
jgi:hydrogenase maturation factor HypF (carbamoyltransferase family)